MLLGVIDLAEELLVLALHLLEACLVVGLDRLLFGLLLLLPPLELRHARQLLAKVSLQRLVRLQKGLQLPILHGALGAQRRRGALGRLLFDLQRAQRVVGLARLCEHLLLRARQLVDVHLEHLGCVHQLSIRGTQSLGLVAKLVASPASVLELQLQRLCLRLSRRCSLQ